MLYHCNFICTLSVQKYKVFQKNEAHPEIKTTQEKEKRVTKAISVFIQRPVQKYVTLYSYIAFQIKISKVQWCIYCSAATRRVQI